MLRLVCVLNVCLSCYCFGQYYCINIYCDLNIFDKYIVKYILDCFIQIIKNVEIKGEVYKIRKNIGI